MCFSNVKLSLGVTLLAVIILPCFECDVANRKPIIEGDNGEVLFIDGVRRRNRPFGSDSSAVRIGDGDSANDDYFPFIDGLRGRIPRSLNGDESEGIGFAGNVEPDGYPFIDGLRMSKRPSLGPKNQESDVDEYYPFINGLRSKKPEVQVGADWMKDDFNENEYFINGRPRRPIVPLFGSDRSRRSAEGGSGNIVVEQYRPELSRDDESEFINGFLRTTRIGEVSESKKSVESSANHRDSVSLFSSEPRKVENHTSDDPTEWFTSGKREEGDRRVFEKILRKPFRITYPASMYAEYHGENEQDSCPINFIIVRCTNTLCEVDRDIVEFVSGGVGEKSFKVKITTHNTHLYKYLVQAYTKCT